MRSIRDLRRHAVSQSLFKPTTLKKAIYRLGFVQADPISAPARAQDLILRQRVKSYRAGDLDQKYASLDIEEGVLYAYGFLPREIWQLRYHRDTRRLRHLERKVFDIVSECRETHPRELEAHLGRKRAINDWGGYSKATTLALESLRGRGLLRIARRENGIRIYEPAIPFDESISPKERLKKIVMITARTLAPLSELSLQFSLGPARRRIGDTRTAVAELLRSGELEKEAVDGISYVWPGAFISNEEPRAVRFLAPFDPIVWDRRRFEHLWGWAYRFEAYTPIAKRVRGYYALPILWQDHVVGWVNARVVEGKLSVEPGFIEGKPKDKPFWTAFDEELDKFETFLFRRRPVHEPQNRIIR